MLSGDHVKCHDGWNAVLDGTVISLALKKPKKHVEQATHIMCVSRSRCLANQTLYTCLRIDAVIGKCGFKGNCPPFLATPLITSFKRGKEDSP